MMIHRRSRPTVEERSKKATPNAVGVAHYAPLGAAGIMALIGPFCKPHVQRGVMIMASYLREGSAFGYALLKIPASPSSNRLQHQTSVSGLPGI